MYGILDNYIRLISVIWQNNTDAVKVRNEIVSRFCIESGVQ